MFLHFQATFLVVLVGQDYRARAAATAEKLKNGSGNA